MTWAIALTQHGNGPGDLMATVDDEVATKIRNAILGIIARPVFEREEQTRRLFSDILAAEAPKEKRWGNPHSPTQKKLRRFLKETLTRDKDGALGADEMVVLWNQANPAHQLSESAMGTQLHYLVAVEHRVQRARGAGKNTDPKRFGYWWPECPHKATPEVTVDAGIGVRP